MRANKDKYMNMSPAKRFIHKNTGYIICAIILTIAIPLYLMEVNSVEFFEKWTCEQIKTYYLLDGAGRFPKVSELDDEQRVKFYQIMGECGLTEDIYIFGEK